MTINECEAKISRNPVADAIAMGSTINPLTIEQIVEAQIICRRCNIAKPHTERGFGRMGLDDAMINSNEALRRFREISCPLLVRVGQYGNR